jgi:2-dehydro-3-deoxyglucarate aldolase/4-hydroxy-2-oxoheptanedioate aldolase
MENTFKTRLARRETLVGPLVAIPAPDVAETLALVGFDYLWVEMEHAPMGLAQAQMMIQAVGGRCPCLVRVPENAEAWIKRALDLGCDGIVIPQVKSAAEARQAVECCLYPPAGRRGVGIGRAHGYGLSFRDYVETANDQLAIILQVEHVEGVRNIRSIVETPGVDAILIGPFDLSGSLGLLGQIDHPEVTAAIQEIQRSCKAAGMPIGMFAVDAPSARRCIDDGVSLIAMGIDVWYLWQAAQQALNEVRRAGA